MKKDKIETGEYVRLKNGEIAKIEKCYGKDIGYKNMEYYDIDIYSNTFKGFTIYKEDILKHSKNIIDLIEVGDYVNGSKVIDIAQGETKAVYIESQEQKFALIPIVEKQIKLIVTKEQFKEMEYRV